MTVGPAPLLDVFYELRQRNFPLGMPDYETALAALVAGTGITTRQDLIFMCQLVWAKTVEEQKQVAEVLEAHLPRELTPQQLEQLKAGPVTTEVPPSAAPPVFDSEAPNQLPQAETSSAMERETEFGDSKALSSEDVLDVGFQMAESATGEEIRISAVETAWHLNPRLDFIGSLPVSKRQMKRAWRYYRRMRRVGPPAELDVEATIEEIYRRGIFLKPVLIPRRQNQARVLILIDEQGSMVPFRRVTQALVESAKQNGLARASILFFHDVPGNRLFYDPWLQTSEIIAHVLRFFSDAGVLIVSDGGAARGNCDPIRLAHTKDFIGQVRRYTPNIAWLNPTPAQRWSGTTAGAIREECAIPMFGLERTGLDAAVNVLRGMSRQ